MDSTTERVAETKGQGEKTDTFLYNFALNLGRAARYLVDGTREAIVVVAKEIGSGARSLTFQRRERASDLDSQVVDAADEGDLEAAESGGEEEAQPAGLDGLGVRVAEDDEIGEEGGEEKMEPLLDGDLVVRDSQTETGADDKEE